MPWGTLSLSLKPPLPSSLPGWCLSCKRFRQRTNRWRHLQIALPVPWKLTCFCICCIGTKVFMEWLAELLLCFITCGIYFRVVIRLNTFLRFCISPRCSSQIQTFFFLSYRTLNVIIKDKWKKQILQCSTCNWLIYETHIISSFKYTLNELRCNEW